MTGGAPGVPETPGAPDTVTEAVRLLRSLGYDDDLELTVEGLSAGGCLEPGSSAVVTHQFRFEGNSDPADEAIVLGIVCPTVGRKGVLVAGYGASMAPEHVELMHALIGH